MIKIWFYRILLVFLLSGTVTLMLWGGGQTPMEKIHSQRVMKQYLSGEHSSAVAEQQQGIYIFLMCKPAAPYEYQGSVKKGVAWTGKPAEMLNSMIKKCKNDFPTANGIVFSSIEMDKADCIKFKE